ncbi:hypothetical protein ACJMK2_011534 [Sinanodonta woodiana]|uniref:Sphingomyelin phosphodiesterase n=1 Tax=Sinanodonta woodiana TaxID=1069815 RepID=A0ABD3V5F8_SINWO
MEVVLLNLGISLSVSLLLLMVSSAPLLFIQHPGSLIYDLEQLDFKKAAEEREYECGAIRKFSETDCDICKLFVNMFQLLVKQGSTQEEVVKLFTAICKNFKIEDERVCESITIEFKDELFGVAERLVLTPNEVCGILIGDTCGTPYNPATMWNVTLPIVPKPPVNPPIPPKEGSPRLRVLHLTDIHLDQLYIQGSNAQCGEPLCCRADDGPPAPDHDGAGKWGDYRGCDTPYTLLNSLFMHLKSIQDQFDYIVFTGDLPPHNVWNQSREDQLGVLNIVAQMFLTYLPGKMVFHALGNHESAPVNSFPPPFITGNQSETWLYSALAVTWDYWLPESTFSTILKGGFYSVRPFPGLKIISLNMNFCNNGNWWLLINTTDPAGQLEWFIDELQESENIGEKVHVIGHIYPGSGSCIKAYSWNYYKIMNRYESTITGQFFGHSHADLFEVMYDDVNFTRPTGVVYIPGSVTTYTDLNPGYRIYEIDGNYTESSWQVLDFTNYYLNLTEANQSGNAEWKMEYNAKTAYGLNNLYPKNWNDLIYRMKDDDDLFQKFYRHNSKSAVLTPCTGDCKTSLLCDLKTGRSHDPNLCNDL